MTITKQLLVGKLVNYLDNRITLDQLVDWAEEAIREGDFAEENKNHLLRDVVSRLGLADVKAFGLEWENYKNFLNQLGYEAKIVVQPQP